MRISLLLLLLAAAVRAQPEPVGCKWEVTIHPSWQFTAYHEAYVSPCEYQITNGMPSPNITCPWVGFFSRYDSVKVVTDNAYGGGQCIEPLVLCVSGDCP